MKIIPQTFFLFFSQSQTLNGITYVAQHKKFICGSLEMSVLMMEASPPLLSASDGLVLDLLAASDSGREREREMEGG